MKTRRRRRRRRPAEAAAAGAIRRILSLLCLSTRRSNLSRAGDMCPLHSSTKIVSVERFAINISHRFREECGLVHQNVRSSRIERRIHLKAEHLNGKFFHDHDETMQWLPRWPPQLDGPVARSRAFNCSTKLHDYTWSSLDKSPLGGHDFLRTLVAAGIG